MNYFQSASLFTLCLCINHMLHIYTLPVIASPKQRYHRRLKWRLVTPTSFSLTSPTGTPACLYIPPAPLEAPPLSSGISASDSLWSAWVWVSWKLHIYHHYRWPLSPPPFLTWVKGPARRKIPFNHEWKLNSGWVAPVLLRMEIALPHAISHPPQTFPSFAFCELRAPAFELG